MSPPRDISREHLDAILSRAKPQIKQTEIAHPKALADLIDFVLSIRENSNGILLSFSAFLQSTSCTWSRDTFGSRVSEFNGFLKEVCTATLTSPEENDRPAAIICVDTIEQLVYRFVWVPKTLQTLKGVRISGASSSQSVEPPSIADASIIAGFANIKACNLAIASCASESRRSGLQITPGVRGQQPPTPLLRSRN